MSKPIILVIVGPTAVGKTKYAIELAKELNGEIVSADSMQLYQYMDIGSAKPDARELSTIRHHLIDMIDPRQGTSVAEYQKLAKHAIADICNRGKLPVISGGTGLYVNSLLFDMDFSKVKREPSYHLALEQQAAMQGKEAVFERLKTLDPDAANRIHPNNLKKVLRALELLELGNDKPKEFDGVRSKPGDFTVVLIGLYRSRQELYNRIDSRVDQMIESGLVQEVFSLKQLGLTEQDVSMQGIGYKEIFGYLKGIYALPEAIRLIKQRSRNYAKRQLTWFRRYEEIQWFDISGQDILVSTSEITQENTRQRKNRSIDPILEHCVQGGPPEILMFAKSRISMLSTDVTEL